jgi:hypothetical protein
MNASQHKSSRPLRHRLSLDSHAKMVLKLYGHPFSTCTKRVLVVLKETRTPFELEVVDIRSAYYFFVKLVSVWAAEGPPIQTARTRR